MKTHRTILLFIVFSVLLSFCSPKPIFRLHSDHDKHDKEDIVLYRGMEYLISHGEYSAAIIAYYRHLNNLVIMDLEIINHSDEMVRVDPTDVSFKAYRTKNDGVGNPDDKDRKQDLIAEGTAMDPEKMLLNIDKQTSREKAKGRTNLVLESISASMDLAIGLSSAANEATNKHTLHETQRTREAIEWAERRENIYRNVSSLSERRAYWEAEAFRATDLQSGESIAGEISSPLVKKSTMLEISIPVGEDEHIFVYKQKKSDA